jgi:hypothetical protein
MVGSMVVWADQHEIVEFGGSAVLPMDHVMGMKTAGGSAAGYHAAAIPVLEDAA